ncbi:unnamed protein product [Leptidea sinapis]|uniref:Uncharacterized protein n=1 Tax=Leptidea sinapis TaxID=189913 RepID=A0A5E4QVS5_9NEOP|nr:unnamed protein product [Leptidea sinapis]
MSVLNNFSVSIAKGLRRLRNNELTDRLSARRQHASKEQSLKMEKCLIVSKVTRYEYEKHSHDNISDGELEMILRKRGSDFESMISTHREQKTFEESIDLQRRADKVVKPVIGFNSAPHKSVGRLCLPTWCSNDVKGAFSALKEIPISIEPGGTRDDQKIRNWQPSYDFKPSNKSPASLCSYIAGIHRGERDLESFAAAASNRQRELDAHEEFRSLCHYRHGNINCLRTHSVMDLMKILHEEFGVKMDISLEKAREVTEKYNQRLMFPPECPEVAYSVREYIRFEEWPAPRGLRV